jgi:hypothetical protein
VIAVSMPIVVMRMTRMMAFTFEADLRFHVADFGLLLPFPRSRARASRAAFLGRVRRTRLPGARRSEFPQPGPTTPTDGITRELIYVSSKSKAPGLDPIIVRIFVTKATPAACCREPAAQDSWTGQPAPHFLSSARGGKADVRS